MAIRTISRDAANTRVVLVWPKSVMLDDIGVNSNGAHYAVVDDAVVQPVTIAADVFKAAFGFVPVTGSINEYELTKLS